MSVYVCKRCSAHFAVGLHRCPQCTGESAYYLDDAAEAEVLAGGPPPGQEGTSMAKNTVHGGASNARLDEVTEEVPGAELVPNPDPEDGPDDPPVEAGEASGDGSAETRSGRGKPAKAASRR